MSSWMGRPVWRGRTTSKSRSTSRWPTRWRPAKPLFLALSPRRAAEVALAVAEAVDRKVTMLPDDLVSRNAAMGTPVNLVRATHRREHLDEIEHALALR